VAQSKQEFHSLMILRHGHVVAEGWWAPYSSEHRQQLYSLSKSFTSTAIGFAVTEGLLSVDDPVIKFFPGDLPVEISENLAALKVRHLLSMSVGHGKDSIMILEASVPRGSLGKDFPKPAGSLQARVSVHVQFGSQLHAQFHRQKSKRTFRTRIFASKTIPAVGYP